MNKRGLEMFKIGDKVKITGRLLMKGHKGIIVATDERWSGELLITVKFIDKGYLKYGYYYLSEIEKIPYFEDDKKFLELFE